ncbi:MAG: hypothetical protein U0Q16_30225 [Bryobacteraceae bacterium]
MAELTLVFVRSMARWGGRGDADPWQPMAAKAEVIRVARTTKFYGKLLKGRVNLARLPVVERAYYFSHGSEFRSARARDPRPVRLVSPWPGGPEITVIQPWFGVAAERVLPRFDPAWFQGTQFAALAAASADLVALAEAVLQGAIAMPPLEFGAIAFDRIGATPFSEQDRDLVWKALGAPVFVELRGLIGERLAAECDCHEGLHVNPAAAIVELRDHESREILLTNLLNHNYPVLRLATGLSGVIAETPCGCGAVTPRLMNLEKIAVQRTMRAGA